MVHGRSTVGPAGTGCELCSFTTSVDVRSLARRTTGPPLRVTIRFTLHHWYGAQWAEVGSFSLFW